jgi:hypothetical protein
MALMFQMSCPIKVGGDSKIPILIYYDQDRNVRVVGAEAVREGIKDDAEWQGTTLLSVLISLADWN